jgi:hypothetical protein
VLIAYLSCTACTSWRMNALSPQAAVQGHPRTLRVTRTDSSQVILHDPGLQGDSIVGITPQQTRVGVPLDSVAVTHTRRTSAVKTVFAVVGVAAAAFAAVVIGFVIHCNHTDCFGVQR